MKRTTFLLLLSLGITLPLSAQDDQGPDKANQKPRSETKESVTKHASVTIDGNAIDYTVTTSELTLSDDSGNAEAHIFNVSYIKKGETDPSKRPVLFAFNGGPGSSAVWLHLGALGPRIVPTSPDGTQPLDPPVIVKENPFSILNVTDLVFIDPVSTGLSRADDPEKAGKFHGLRGDLSSMGEFIRRWTTENKRWSSPKYILGESYGAIRAAGLSDYVQSQYGMSMNGVILLSGLLDFRTLSPSAGNDLCYSVYLPALAATAHYHGVIKGDRDQLMQDAQLFADTTYTVALNKGSRLSNEEKEQVAGELAKYTGLSKEWILENNIRIHPTKFRKELLASQNKVLGRFDARVAWDSMDSGSSIPSYDPSFSVAKGAFSTAMLDYLTRDLGWEDQRTYEILTGKVHPWKWGAENSYVNLSDSIEDALRDNPKARFLVLCGRTDLATPPGGILHSIDHLSIPDSLRKNISVQWYDGGHMFYLNQPDLEKLHKDLSEFIK